MLARAAVALLVALMVVVPTRGEDDEPEFLDIKLSAWIKRLQDPANPIERRRGAYGVEQIGNSQSRLVVPALIKALKEEKDEKTRAFIARTVGRAVAKAFADAREDRADTLPRMDDARNALTSLMRTDTAEAVREAAAMALGDIGTDARAAASALGAVLQDKHAGVVRAAAAALRRMGKDAKEALPDLRTLLANSKADPDARVDAAVSLGLVGTDISTTMPFLRAVVSDTTNSVPLRKACIEALGRLGKDAGAASEALGNVLTDAKAPDELRLAAASVLSTFANEAKPAVPALIKAISDREKLVRCLAMQALGKMGKDLGSHRKETTLALLKAADDFNVAVRVSAIEALGAMAEEGYAGEADNVVKLLDKIISSGGRADVIAAAKAARDKARPSK